MRRVLVLMPVVATLLLALVVVRHPAGPGARARDERTEPRATAVLRRWDADRARAWAHGDVAALRALYAPGSRTGAQDVAMLRRWQDRGWVVRRGREQLFVVRVLTHSRTRWVLRVTDRLVDAVAVDGRRARPLPQDAASTTRVVLRRGDHRWQVVEAYRVGQPAR